MAPGWSSLEGRADDEAVHSILRTITCSDRARHFLKPVWQLQGGKSGPRKPVNQLL